MTVHEAVVCFPRYRDLNVIPHLQKHVLRVGEPQLLDHLFHLLRDLQTRFQFSHFATFFRDSEKATDSFNVVHGV